MSPSVLLQRRPFPPMVSSLADAGSPGSKATGITSFAVVSLFDLGFGKLVVGHDSQNRDVREVFDLVIAARKAELSGMSNPQFPAGQHPYPEDDDDSNRKTDHQRLSQFHDNQ